MSELYVPLSKVLDLIDITNTADGFSNYNAYLDLHNAVEDLPTITEACQNVGQWLSGEYYVETGQTKCSCCNTEYYVSDLLEIATDFIPENDGILLTRYCPNCGAKMQVTIND